MSRLRLVKELPEFDGGRFAIYELPDEWKERLHANYVLNHQYNEYTFNKDNHDGMIAQLIREHECYLDVQFTETVKEAELYMAVYMLRERLNAVDYYMRDMNVKVLEKTSILAEIDRSVFNNFRSDN